MWRRRVGGLVVGRVCKMMVWCGIVFLFVCLSIAIKRLT